eukprot:SAG31_NODE_457_length_15415_cov_4.380387_23_plen_66_part_00
MLADCRQRGAIGAGLRQRGRRVDEHLLTAPVACHLSDECVDYHHALQLHGLPGPLDDRRLGYRGL